MMKQNLLIIGLTFMITWTVMTGIRLSSDAIAVIIGVVLGISATIPATGVIIFFLLRHQQKSFEKQIQAMPTPGPPVIVVNGSSAEKAAYPAAGVSQMSPTLNPQGRKWTVVGEEAE